MTTDITEPEVLFETRENAAGQQIGFARLNRPASLNALNLNMCQLLLEQFRQWAADERIAAVVLCASGDKGFSAGGDVATVVRNVRGGAPDRYVYGDSFFDVEYTLDLLIHRYPKPLISFSHGVCMGGGVGLTVGASHRIVAEQSKIAMPEIHIGLFPDVGGGYFLNRVPAGIGRVLALTGLIINEADAIFAGLADYFVPREMIDELWDQLAAADWTSNPTENGRIVTRLIQTVHRRCKAGLPTCGLLQYLDGWRFIASQPSTAELLDALQVAAGEDPYFEAAAKSLQRGSPTTALITESYLDRARHMSLQQVLEMDLVMARQFQRHHDFPEGVRALLIDKDRKPTWEAASFDTVDPATVARHFKPLGVS